MYARLIFNVRMMNLPILHIPVYAPEIKYEIIEEAEINWIKVVETGSVIIGGVLAAVGLFFLLGSVVHAIATTVIGLYEIGIEVIQGILKLA